MGIFDGLKNSVFNDKYNVVKNDKVIGEITAVLSLTYVKNRGWILDRQVKRLIFTENNVVGLVTENLNSIKEGLILTLATGEGATKDECLTKLQSSNTIYTEGENIFSKYVQVNVNTAWDVHEYEEKSYFAIGKITPDAIVNRMHIPFLPISSPLLPQIPYNLSCTYIQIKDKGVLEYTPEIYLSSLENYDEIIGLLRKTKAASMLTTK